ncbi:MAG: HAD family hydrolase [Ardenticatenaceae bacterium]
MSTSNTRPTSIVFDFGGVLIGWNPRNLYRKLFNGDEAAMEDFLANVCTQEWNVKQDAGRPLAEATEILVAKFPAYEDLIRAYYDRWEEMISGPIEGTVEILTELKAANYPLFGLSNWSAETFARLYPRPPYHFLHWFEVIVLSGKVKLVKPDPAIYDVLLKRSNRSPQECLFIDDSYKNIAAARELGFHAIHFQSPHQLRSELREMGVL